MRQDEHHTVRIKTQAVAVSSIQCTPPTGWRLSQKQEKIEVHKIGLE